MKGENNDSTAQMLHSASVLYLDGKDADKVKDFLTSGHFLWRTIDEGSGNERIAVFNAGRATVEYMAKRYGVAKYAYSPICEGGLADYNMDSDAKDALMGILPSCEMRVKEIVRSRISDNETARRYLRESLAGGMNAYYKRIILYGKENL